jgi:hypothetical protein
VVGPVDSWLCGQKFAQKTGLVGLIRKSTILPTHTQWLRPSVVVLGRALERNQIIPDVSLMSCTWPLAWSTRRITHAASTVSWLFPPMGRIRTEMTCDLGRTSVTLAVTITSVRADEDTRDAQTAPPTEHREVAPPPERHFGGFHREDDRPHLG